MSEPSGRSFFSRAASNPVSWLLLIGFMFTWPIARSIQAARQLPANRPVIGKVPAFELVDQKGERLGGDTLRGQVWIASFAASDCLTICPAMIEQMSRIQHRVRGLGAAIKLVTFSYDPGVDTPEKFAAFADKHRVSPRIWAFATGERDQVDTVLHTFGIAAAPQTRFFLVDREMNIRGYYDLSDPTQQDVIVRDAGLLVNRGG